VSAAPQLCTCTEVHATLDLTSSDTKTFFVTTQSFNISSIADDCPSLLNINIQEYLSTLGIRAVCDSSNSVVQAAGGCGNFVLSGVYISFTSNLTSISNDWNSYLVLQDVIQSAFMRRFSITGVRVIIDIPYNETNGRGTARVLLGKTKGMTNDYSAFSNVTSVSIDASPFNSTYGSLNRSIHVDVHLGQFMYTQNVISDTQTYKDADTLRNQFRHILYDVRGSPKLGTFVKDVLGVSLSQPNQMVRSSVPFSSFRSGSCTANAVPFGDFNPFYELIFSEADLQKKLPGINFTDNSYAYSSDVAHNYTTARSASVQKYVETYFMSVSLEQLYVVSSKTSLAIIPAFIFNTTDPSKFQAAHVVRGNLVAVPMNDPYASSLGMLGINKVSGVVGNSSTGYILNKAVDTCSTDQQYKLINETNSPALVGWTNVVKCYPESSAPSKDSPWYKNPMYIGVIAAIVIVFAATLASMCYCYVKRKAGAATGGTPVAAGDGAEGYVARGRYKQMDTLTL